MPPEQAPSGQALPQEDLSGQQQQEGFQDPSGTDLGGDDFKFPDDGFGGERRLHAADASTLVVSHQYRQVGSGEHVDAAPDPPLGGYAASVGCRGGPRLPPGCSRPHCLCAESSMGHPATWQELFTFLCLQLWACCKGNLASCGYSGLECATMSTCPAGRQPVSAC